MDTISKIKPKRKKWTKPKTKVQALRQSAGVTLRTAAVNAGVSAATLSRIERGNPPDIRTALKLARFFETTVEELFGSLAA